MSCTASSRPEERVATHGGARGFHTPRHVRGRSRGGAAVASGMRITAASLAVVLVAGVSVAGVAAWRFGATVQGNAVDISNGGDDDVAAPASIGPFPGGFNVLAVGADNSPEQGESYGDRGSEARNDVNIVLHVAADHTSAVALSLPRDLVVPHPSCTDPVTGETYDSATARPLNEAFAHGGLGCVRATVEKLTGLSIPYAATFTFAGTVAMSDAVGGVPICLDHAIFDDESGLDLPAGVSVVEGAQALAYLRSRGSVGDGSDLSRISSQQAYMSSLMRVMKSSDTLTDIPKLVTLANAAAQNVSLSVSLANVTTMASMAITLADLDLDNVVFVQFPNVEYPANKNKVMPDADLAEKLMDKIQADEPFGLAADSLGSSVTVAPGTGEQPSDDPDPAPTEAPTGTAPPAQPGGDAAVAAGPEVLEGLRGQTARQETCSVAN